MTVDANDIPPGSRLFLVVPREADTHLLQTELSRFDGCEHVKVDAVAAKGVCFAKYETASAARMVMNEIHRAECKLGPYRVKVFPAEPKDSSSRTAAHAHANLSPTPQQQLNLPDNLFDCGPFHPGGPMNEGLGRADLSAVLGLPSSYRGNGGHPVPSSGGSIAPQSGASAPAAPQSSGNLWSPPHSMHPLSGGSIVGGGVGAGQGAPMHDATTSGLHVSHRLLQQEAHNHKVAVSQGHGPVFDSSTAGQQLAQLFANLHTHEDGPGGPAARMSPANMPTGHAYGHMMLPPGGQIGDSNARQLWQDTSPRRHLSTGLGNQNPCSGVGILGDGGSSSTTGPAGLGSSGLVASPGESFSSQTGAYSHGWPNPPGSGRTNSPGQSAAALGGGVMGQGPEVSLQRLFVVVSKSATEEQIAKQFKRFGGMEYCNLKRDKKTGQSKGYCFVNYSTADSAAAAMKALNGIEFPTGSGRNMKVIYSEVLPTNKPGGVNRGPGGQPSSMGPSPGSLQPKAHTYDCTGPGMFTPGQNGTGGRYHYSCDALSLPHSRHSGPPSQEAPSLGGSMGLPQPADASHALFEGNFADFVAAHNIDTSKGLLSIPAGPAPLPPPPGSRGAGPGTGVMQQGRPHSSLSPSPRRPQPRDTAPPPSPRTPLCDPTVLLVHITKPLPEYALEHEFSKFGAVLSVQLLDDNRCYAMVHMEDPVAAAKAAAGLHSSQLCGMPLTVEVSDLHNSVLRGKFLSVSSTSVSGHNSHYPGSRGPSSHGLSSTGSMQTTAPFQGAILPGPNMPHFVDRGKPQPSSSDLLGFAGPFMPPPHVPMHGGHSQGAGMAPMQSPAVGPQAPYAWWMQQG